MSWGVGVGTCPGAIDGDWVEKHKDKRFCAGGLIGSQPRKEDDMTLKLTVEQAKKVAELSAQIAYCEAEKDSGGPYRYGQLFGDGHIPISTEAMHAAANAEIARCHEELKAMGISLMPSEAGPRSFIQAVADHIQGDQPAGFYTYHADGSITRAPDWR